MIPYAITIFTGAFLLFQVQPLIGKYILPWFGGSTGVWTTCMLFFQMLLLGGYAYAHWSTTFLKPRTQAIVHLAVLALALATLPIIPADAWKPKTPENPVGHILLLLTVCLGLPYFVLSTTGPLLQQWFNQAHPGVSPYRLYALSNLGSLLALVSYPFYFENHFSRKTQAAMWSWGLVMYALVCGYCALRLMKQPSAPGGPAAARAEGEAPEKPSLYRRVLWLMLPACASVLLLATTNKICLDVAVIPFLWVLPLGLYLLTFIICFDSPRWYNRWVFIPLFSLAAAGVCYALFEGTRLSMPKQIAFYSAGLLISALVCHGEVYRLKPHPRYLTGYYLAIAAGGALGGLFVGLAAPVIFRSYLELHVGLFACGLLIMTVCFVESFSGPYRRIRLFGWAFLSLGVFGMGAALTVQAWKANEKAVVTARNFYGVLSVFEYYKDSPESHYYLLQNGRITHGLQFTESISAAWATTYYGKNSGIALAWESRTNGLERRLGVVGLGVGTLSCFGKVGDYVRIYEINPAVEQLARSRFTYLTNCPGKLEVIMGDARLSMENETPQDFDVLALDAFTSDSIPIHLLTREAVEIYLRHLKPDGILAVHISNRYLDLEPVVANVAEHFKLQLASVSDDNDDDEWWMYNSTWVLLTRDKEIFANGRISETKSKSAEKKVNLPLWTDDYASLLQILQ